jgi:hypothetical protein
MGSPELSTTLRCVRSGAATVLARGFGKKGGIARPGRQEREESEQTEKRASGEAASSEFHVGLTLRSIADATHQSAGSSSAVR